MNRMTWGESLAQLVRMRDMKVKRLQNYRGTPQSASFLRADIGALNRAIDAVDEKLRENASTPA